MVGVKTRVLPIIGCFWLFVVLDSFFIWNSYENIIKLLACIFVVVSTFYCSYRHLLHVYFSNLLIAISVALFYLWLTVRVDMTFASQIVRACMFIPLLLMLFWPRQVIVDIYELFRKLIVFFAFGSISVSILYILGLNSFVPHYELQPQSALHERLGYVYYVYGCFVIVHDALSSILPRANGMLQEPGHFAIILGFVYLVERLLNKKPNIIMIICGILTFSPNFILLLFLAEFYNAIRRKMLLKVFGFVLAAICFFVFLFFMLPKSLQDEFYFLIFERNMEFVIDALMSSGSLSDALNERTNQSGLSYFYSLRPDEIWTGIAVHDDSIILSDYRGLILNIGILGLLLLIFVMLSLVYKVPFMIKFSFLCMLILVVLHRSWMFYSPYLIYMVYMATVVLKNHDIIKCRML
jgi:hypothetical protein